MFFLFHTAVGIPAALYQVGALVLQAGAHCSPMALSAASCFIPLTWYLTHLCLILSYMQVKSLRLVWITILLTSEGLHVQAFASDNTLVFFIAYEAVLIPLQALTACWGSGSKRLRASLLFFLYTYTGSVPMLIAVLYLTSFSIHVMQLYSSASYMSVYPTIVVYTLWAAFALSFAVKTPLWPFFIWLISAHAEAPVEGSILLAGVVLKLATFGVIAVLLNLLWEGTLFTSSFSLSLGAFTLLIASLSLIQQLDLKCLVALSSVAHMGNGTLGLVSITEEGVGGSILLALSHGLVSPCLFLLMGGRLYNGFQTRSIYIYRGLGVVAPLLSALVFTLLLANIAVPLSPNWVSELLILSGLSHDTLILCFLSAVNVLASAVYTLWLSSRILLGPWSDYLRSAADLRFTETLVMGSLSGLILTMGLFTQALTQALAAPAWGFCSRLINLGTLLDYFPSISYPKG